MECCFFKKVDLPIRQRLNVPDTHKTVLSAYSQEVKRTATVHLAVDFPRCVDWKPAPVHHVNTMNAKRPEATRHNQKLAAAIPAANKTPASTIITASNSSITTSEQ